MHAKKNVLKSALEVYESHRLTLLGPLPKSPPRKRGSPNTPVAAKKARSMVPSAEAALRLYLENPLSEDSKQARVAGICAAIRPFVDQAQKFLPTAWIRVAPRLQGLKLVSLAADSALLAEVSALCKRRRLAPPAAFIVSNSHHYVKYSPVDGTMLTYIALCAATLNRAPGSMGVSVDLAVSVDTEHSVSIALESLKRQLRRRTSACVLFAQVAKTSGAKKFWSGKLLSCKRASLMPVLFQSLDHRYDVYADTSDMAIFYE